MKTSIYSLLAATALALPGAAFAASPMGTAFTYQGQLTSGSNPANGSYDFDFTLYDSPTNGAQVGGVWAMAVPVVNSYFQVTLDFGNAFNGDARWLMVWVKPDNAPGDFFPLYPRQRLAPTPYAIMANSASNVLGTLSAVQLTGTIANSQLASSSVTVTAGTGLGGGGAVALGGSTALYNAGVLSVTGNADIIASPMSGNVALGSTATDANTASRIVRRDAAGNFSANSITLGGNLNLPTTTGSAGAIYAGTGPLLHQYGVNNFFAGTGAGNLAMSGQQNAGTGQGALFSNTSGWDNTAHGYQGLYNNTSGSWNTADGADTLFSNTTGGGNTAIGCGALYQNTSGGGNTALGYSALWANTTGLHNTAAGEFALNYNSTGSNNIALGYNAGTNVTTGSYNIVIGSAGTPGESQSIHLGTQGIQTNTSIAGIYGSTVAAGSPVFVDATGRLGTGGSPSGNGLVPWQTVSNSTVAMAPNAGYLLTTRTQKVTFTLPASPNVGDMVRIASPAGWRLNQNAGQSILTASFGASTWKARASTQPWTGVAMSSNATKLVAVSTNGSLFLSTDSGVTWTASPGAPSSYPWQAVASSADGTKLVAAVNGGYIYTSSDSGATWYASWTAGSANWQAVASSADGTHLLAGSDTAIYLSANSGYSWAWQYYGLPSGVGATAVALSSDGTKLAVATPQIYISVNSGNNWTPANASGRGLASSADGSRLVSVDTDGRIYVSADSGTTWTTNSYGDAFHAVASSSDGIKLMAIGGAAYESFDAGANWVNAGLTGTLRAVAVSADGSAQAIAANGIYIRSETSTVGTSGYVTGSGNAAIELIYLGGGQFMPLSYTGTLSAY